MTGEPNNRVTTKEFYEQLIKTNDKITDMERRIVNRLDKMVEKQGEVDKAITNHCASSDTALKRLDDEVDLLRKRDILSGGITATFAVIAAAIAGYLGVNR
jgi:ferritin-like metal-binding protein YciE